MTLNLNFLQGLLANISARARITSNPGPVATPLADLSNACSALMQPGGEASEIRIARQALEAYAQLDQHERLIFFRLLTEEYGACFRAIHEAYAEFDARQDNVSAQRLFEACEPRRQELLRRLNRHPGATYQLVRMRAHLLNLMRDDNTLQPLDADFSHLFTSWFNRGFLVLETIDWDTPASILERIIRYEAVHEIQDWEDLRSRLNPENRRCYAFFHPATGDEPLIFVEVALCTGTPKNIRDILANEGPEEPAMIDTAVFYSISNCQQGLKGVSFGNFLIKQVAQELKQQLPELKRFVTLSPLPGFVRWLQTDQNQGNSSVSKEVLRLLDDPDSLSDSGEGPLQSQLVALAAHYLVNAKDESGRPLDPVARFHLGNGASLDGIHPAADLSPRGRRQSRGLMVNYLYELDRIEQNHEALSRNGTVVAATHIQRLASRAKPAGAASDTAS
jgi:malonyl-CoA decarboxylase